MSDGLRYDYDFAKSQAMKIVELIGPHCDRIAIAGSIRREKSLVGDIEIVCIPKTVMGGLFCDEPTRDPDFCSAVNSLGAIKGKPTGKYTQRIAPNGMKIDIFMATPENWGVILAIRTGSAEYSSKMLAARWVQLGYHSKGGVLYRDGKPHHVCEECDLFELLGIDWIEPKNRNVS